MATRRHWKQRWDANADFVFLRRIKLGGEHGTVTAGDPVPKDRRIKAQNRTPERRKGPDGKQRLNIRRLKLWWDAGYIGLASYGAPASEREQVARKARVARFDAGVTLTPEQQGALRSPVEQAAQSSADERLVHTGSGWYVLTLPDGTTAKIRGAEAAQAAKLEAWGAEPY